MASLHTLTPLVALVGLVYIAGRAIAAAFGTAYTVGTRHVNFDATTQQVLAPILMLLGLFVTGIVVVSVVRGQWPVVGVAGEGSDEDDEPRVPTPRPPPLERRSLVPWLGLAGLAFFALAHAPSPEHAAEFDPNGHSLLGSYAFAAFAIGIAVLYKSGDLGVLALARTGVGVAAVGLLVSLADSEALQGLLAGVAVALLLPVAFDVFATALSDGSFTNLVAPLTVGIVILTAAALAQGLLSKYQLAFNHPAPAACQLTHAPSGITNFACPTLPTPPLPSRVLPCPSPSPVGNGLQACRKSNTLP